MKLPALGVVSSILVIGISTGFIAAFPLSAFITWVSTLLVCRIPMVVVIGVVWRGNHPGFAARRLQPARGILFVLLAVTAGAVVALIHYVTVGGLISPPTPILSMCLITSVPIAFWLSIMWGGWPFSSMIRSPFLTGSRVHGARADPVHLRHHHREQHDAGHFARVSQPLKGILNTAAAAIIGGALAALFAVSAPVISGRMPAGAPDYIFEIWIASALLAVTFPFLIILADLLQFWPLGRSKERP